MSSQSFAARHASGGDTEAVHTWRRRGWQPRNGTGGAAPNEAAGPRRPSWQPRGGREWAPRHLRWEQAQQPQQRQARSRGAEGADPQTREALAQMSTPATSGVPSLRLQDIGTLRPLAPAGNVFDDTEEDIVEDACVGAFVSYGGVAPRSVGQAPHCAPACDGPPPHPPPPPDAVPPPRWAVPVGAEGQEGSSSGSGSGIAGSYHTSAAAPSTLTSTAQEEWRTTIMLQRIPNTYTELDVRRTLGELGFAGLYDAVYVPMKNGETGRNVTYAFVNFLRPADAVSCIRTCTGRPFGSDASSADAGRVCIAEYSNRQGAAYTSSRASARAQRSKKTKEERRRNRG